MNKETFHKLFRIGLFIIVTLPILNLPPLFSPPHWGKTIIFRIIFSLIIILASWRLLSIIQRINIKELIFNFFKDNRKNTSLLLLLSTIGIVLLSTIFSEDILFSLWGNPTRSGGSVTLISIILLSIFAFFILKEKDWKKVFDISIVIGILVSIIALLQWQGLFPDVLVSLARRPTSTLGNPITLAIYLILLTLPAISFGLKEQNILKRLFYLLSGVLFIFIIMITESRAVYIGLGAAITYFVLFYPIKSRIRSVIRPAFFILIIISTVLVYFINTPDLIPEYLKKDRRLYFISQRLDFASLIYEPRFSAWKVGIESIWDKPILGYGPENFSIAFDKNYDPSLPNIQYIPGSANSWWDRAHNILIDTAVQHGILALILFISLLIVLMWRLQHAKKKHPEDRLIIHGLQATFIGYFVSNLFNFDVFSTHLLFFLFIAYSLFLIHRKGIETEEIAENYRLKIPKKLSLILILMLTIWFNWQYSIKPLQINAKINDAETFLENKRCNEAIEKMDSALKGDTFLNAYVRIRYSTILNECGKLDISKAPEFTKRTYPLLKEAAEMRPTYTRNWAFLGTIITILAEQAKVGVLLGFTPEEIEKFDQEIEEAFSKAESLSPKRQEIYIEWIKADIVAERFELAKEKSQKCIDLGSELAECWWLKGLSEIFLNETDQANEDISIAKVKRYSVEDSPTSLKQLIRAYIYINNMPELIKVTEKLIQAEPDNPQYHSALATAYKQVGEYSKARREALIVLELQPEAKDIVEAFLNSLHF